MVDNMDIKYSCSVYNVQEKLSMFSTSTPAPIKILVADDDNELRQSIVDLIELEGWEALETVNGKNTIETVIKEKPSLIILDHRMPELTGAEVYKELRLKGIQTPVIMVSADYQIKTLANELNIKCFLAKPFGIDEFFSKVRHAIEGKCD